MDWRRRLPRARLQHRILAVAAICLVAYFLRLYRVAAQSLWWDEAISLHLATSTVAEVLADRAAHVHPPLYFLLLIAWTSVAGTSAFSARALSAGTNTLLVAAVYALGCRYVDRATGYLGALFTAGSALYVVYSQEARVYAILPLLYVALLAVVVRLSRTRSDLVASRPAWNLWLLLVVVEVLGLHLHYIFFLAAAYANLLLLLDHWRRRLPLRQWLASVALTVLLCLPWLLVVFANRAAVRADAGVDDPFSERVPLGFFLNLLWSFQWTGLTGAPGYPPLQVGALALAGLLLVAVARLLVERSTRSTTLQLVAHWMVPLAPAVLLWQAKPLSHPRYVAAFSIALLVLTAYAITTIRRLEIAGKALAALLTLGVAVTSFAGIWAWYFEPGFAKDDVRGLADWLEAETEPGDIIVAPWQDWSLDYAYAGQALVIRPNTTDESATWDLLSTQTAEAEQVFLVGYPRGTQDRRGLVPFGLEMAGTMEERRVFKGLAVRRYTLTQPLCPPGPGDSAGASFGPLRLTSIWVEPDAPADTAVTAVAHWQLIAPVEERYRASVGLQDPEGWTWAKADVWLLDRQGLPTDRWQAGEVVTSYHVLPLAPGTPPLTYVVSVEVYTVDGPPDIRYLDLLDATGNPAGRSYRTRPSSLVPALGLCCDPYRAAPDLPAPAERLSLDGLALEAAALDRETAAPGQAIFLTLRWRAETAPLPDLRPVLVLRQDDATLASVSGAPAAGRYPTDRWQAGEIVLDRRQLTVPATARAGPAEVILCLAERCAVLGKVQVTVEEHLFEPPPIANEVHVRFGDVAEMLGYDLSPRPYNSDQPITVTLYWHALDGAAARDYAIFTHVLATDGRLVAQHDGQPVAGTRPTPGWLPGEIVADEHPMVFREAYAGPAFIEVGIYDPATLERVITAGGDDFVVLPSQLNIDYP